MPKVTLLGAPGSAYHLNFDGEQITFRSGAPVEVTVAAASYLLKKLNPKGKPLFLVEFLTEAEPEVAVDLDAPPEQNVDSGPRQTRFPSWPS